MQRLAVDLLFSMISVACASHSDADTGTQSVTPKSGASASVAAAAAPASTTGSAAASASAPAPAVPPEVSLGIADRGIWPDLDGRIQIELPAGLAAQRVSARLDERHRVLVLAIDGVDRKPYPLDGPAELVVGAHKLALRPGDRAELAPLLTAERLTTGSAGRDRDRDGIPDALDLLIGAAKTVVNADAYTEEAQGYIRLAYPMGDVPRSIGVCTDVIVRAARNAGIDLQKELHDDIRRAPAAYPMVKGGGDPNIDHRRVGTLLPYFRRHWQSSSPRLDDPADPLAPGDVIFMDTFPSRSGPDHVGILSDRLDANGLPLVINNWTNGTVTKEMDLLTFVPVLHRFRARR